MVGSFSFSGVENLTGGTANDTFKFSNGKGVAGKVNGGGGTNTLDYSLYTTGVTVNLTAGTATGTGGIANIQNVTGSPANDHITGNGANNVIIGNGGIDVLNGGGGGSDLFILVSTQAAGTTITGAGTTDTIPGANIANTWTISGSNAGSVNGIAFTGIANLTGGSSTDTFKFTSAGSITGKVNGGGGTNTLNYSGDGGIAATVNLVSDTATRTGGFANIQSLVGSSSTADQLIGPNSNNTWTLTGANAGTVGSFSFSAVENLTGGTANDTFKFAAGGSVTGKINGGGGTNTLDYSGDGGAAATVNLATSTATRTGGFASIQSLVGSSSTADKLIGPNTTNTWSITAVNGGTVGSFSFSGIENLTGGSGLDIFVFSAGKSVSGKIDGGGGGNDWLDYAAYTTPVTVNLATGTATGVGGGIANIRDVRGGQGGNTLTGDAQGNILIGGAGQHDRGRQRPQYPDRRQGQGHGHRQLRRRHPHRRLHQLRLQQPRQRPGAGVDPGRVAVGELLCHPHQPHQERRRAQRVEQVRLGSHRPRQLDGQRQQADRRWRCRRAELVLRQSVAHDDQ